MKSEFLIEIFALPLRQTVLGGLGRVKGIVSHPRPQVLRLAPVPRGVYWDFGVGVGLDADGVRRGLGAELGGKWAIQKRASESAHFSKQFFCFGQTVWLISCCLLVHVML